MGELNVWFWLIWPNFCLLLFIYFKIDSLPSVFESKIEALDKDICHYEEQMKEMRREMKYLAKKDFTEDELLHYAIERLRKESFKDLKRSIEAQKEWHKDLSDNIFDLKLEDCRKEISEDLKRSVEEQKEIYDEIFLLQFRGYKFIPPELKEE